MTYKPLTIIVDDGEEHCPKCDGIMERVTIDDHESWACPKDAYAYAVDQDMDIYA